MSNDNSSVRPKLAIASVTAFIAALRDQDLRLYISMDESAETWSLDEIQLVFDRLSNKG